MDKYKALEMAECAKINFKNFINMLPSAESNPFAKLVEWQIDECIKALESDD